MPAAFGDLPDEGWYLMSTADLERWLATLRSGAAPLPAGALPLTRDQAIAHRNAGNLPDPHDRTLRLLLHVRDAAGFAELSTRRLLFEPDFHEPPTWRREGSARVNVVPVRVGPVSPSSQGPWWEEPKLAELESHWHRTGKVGDLVVPADYRSFVYKTVLTLEAAGKPVTVQTVADSIARWVSPAQAEEIRRALADTNDAS